MSVEGAGDVVTRTRRTGRMDFWPEFLATTWGKEFVAGGLGGMAGIFTGYPLDTLRIRQQDQRLSTSTSTIPKTGSTSTSALAILRRVAATDGPLALYRGMSAPLASVTFQNAVAFQIYAVLSRVFDSKVAASDPPSFKGVALGGIGTGAIQSLMLTPIELLKIRLQLSATHHRGPASLARTIFRTEGFRGLYRGLTVTVLRDAPAHGVYFWTYEYAREKLHPGCRKSGQESFHTMLVAGGLAGVASWICCYPLDVIKTRIQADPQPRYRGIVDCFRRSVEEEGFGVMWRGLGTAVARAFVVNGAIFTAYETALRFFNTNATNNNNHTKA